jgi:hypothetical protein
MKDKTLEIEGSIKEKASETIGTTKERLGSTLQTLWIKHKTTEFVKKKASKTPTIVEEPYR